MSARLAILCPGQGGQQRTMFDMARSDPRTAAMLETWPLEAVLGRPLPNALEQDTLMFTNRVAQPLVVAASLAAWEALRNALPAPQLVAGYSIGELTAYAVAGALTDGEAIHLSGQRAQLMDDCVQACGPQGLLAITGTRPGPLQQLLQEHGLFIAIETGEDSFIVGGMRNALAAFKDRLADTPARLTMLPVDVASHTPLMQGAAARFAEVLQRSQFIDPRTPVLSGISAHRISGRADAIAALSRQLEEKIRWADCMDACAESGITVALELGPGSALSRMLQARHPHIQSRSVADFRSLDGVVKWMARCCE